MTSTTPNYAAEPAVYGTSMSAWARNTWSTMYAIAFTFPPNPTNDDRAAYHLFFETIGKVLPCHVCRKHYQEHVASKPIDTRSTRALTEWLLSIHNAANASLGKPPITYESAVRFNLPPAARGLVANPPPASAVPDSSLNHVLHCGETWGDAQIGVTIAAAVVLVFALVLAGFAWHKTRKLKSE